MTRRFLDDIRAEINGYLVTDGNTTADELRLSLIDMIDSTINDECAIFTTAPTLGIDVTDDWTKVNSTVYDGDQGGDGSFLIPSFATGDIETSSTAGFTYTIICSVSFEGDTGDRYDFTITENDIPIGLAVSENAEGNNDPVSATIYHQVKSAPSGAKYALAIRSQNATDQIDIISCQLNVTIQPTNNP